VLWISKLVGRNAIESEFLEDPIRPVAIGRSYSSTQWRICSVQACFILKGRQTLSPLVELILRYAENREHLMNFVNQSPSPTLRGCSARN